MSENDAKWMARALDLASQAEKAGEVPVGAVLVRGEELLAEGFNSPIANHDMSAHAEIRALRAACRKEKNYRLPGTTLFVSLEPCAMCAGAIVHARIERVVIATAEPRAGAAGSVFNILEHDELNHRCVVEFGLMQAQSSALLKSFFRKRRVAKD